VMLSGRRYETFSTAAAFRRFAEASSHSLKLAAPVVARHGILLAVENHKDWRTDELLDLLKRVSSEHVGICVDLGNSIALLEDPMEVVEAYAPWALTTHVKDLGVAECAYGFLLSEVPLGTGFLDLKAMVQTLRKKKPQIRLNLEMITRDPLTVPCLRPSYWTTLDRVPARQLAAALTRNAASGAGGAIANAGTLTLNNLGNPNALFVFQIGSTLTTASNSAVIFSSSLTDSNVFWQVGSSATLGTSTSFEGNILALTSITLNNGASIGCGSALAINGAVTLNNNVIGGGCSGGSTVPEPGTIALMGTGLVALAGVARRKMRV